MIPRQLPAAPASFVGRHDELDRLDTGPFEDGTPAMVLISAIGGTGGIGKTWLALTWAHRNLDRFPDGQLFVDLHGFSPTGRQAHPADVLGGFLDALGVDRDRQPNDPDLRSGMYRSLVADKRMLIVLDNAVTIDQVTPLLPGGGHCTVLITSRNHLRGLVARHGARPVHLDVLTDTEAHTLLTTALGSDGATTPAVAELTALCGGFPLALGLIAARITADPHLPVSDIVTELRTLGVEALDSDDPTASLPTVLSWSLHHLTGQQRQTFALLGIAPGPDTGLPAAAHLADLPERDTHSVLRALADASLIDRVPGNRYAMHDLVRSYATDTAHQQLPEDTQKAALRRVLDFYSHTAHTADRLLHPHRELAPPFDPPTEGVHPQPLPDAAAALAWFDAEHACLLAAQHTAIALEWHPTVWHLAWSLRTYHYRRGHRRNQLAMWQAATDAAPHLPDHATHTIAHQHLGRGHADLGHHEDALNHLHHALTLAEDYQIPLQQAHSHHTLAWVWARQGDRRKALDHARRALGLFRDLDHSVGEAEALNNVGWYAALLGDYDTAREHCQAALVLHRRHHYLDGEAGTLDSLGYIDHHTGNHARAVNHYRQALDLYRKDGNTYDTANTLDDLGHVHAALGHAEQVRTVWREALQLYRAQGRHEDAGRVQRQLDTLEP